VRCNIKAPAARCRDSQPPRGLCKLLPVQPRIRNIYERSERAGQRVMESMKRFITEKLKLKGNESSAVGKPQERKFLGFSFTSGKDLKRKIAPKAIDRFQERVREITHKGRGRSMEKVMEELTPYLRGWRGYFGFFETPAVLRQLDSWIRRRVRCAFWQQWKTGRKRYAELIRRGVSAEAAAKTAGSRCGPWRVSQSPALDRALSNAYLASLGLPSLVEGRSHNQSNRRIRIRMYGGWEEWRSDPPAIPIVRACATSKVRTLRPPAPRPRCGSTAGS
jgi:hypothetical protein